MNSATAGETSAGRLVAAPEAHAVATASGHVTHTCGNCDAILSGPYCSQCGQHAHASARDLAAVLHDGWHDLTHVDGRLWHTLWLLFRAPGRLTVDYFHERRARYLPPVRLYLVLSVVFFSIGVSTGETHKVERTGQPPAEAAEATQADDDDLPDTAVRVNLAKGAGAEACGKIQLAGIATLERAVRESCTRNLADGGTTFMKTLTHNIPKMMFVFLPLMAGIMTLLYWRPRRYYVEHLVFLLHNHSALFLCFVLVKLIESIARVWHPMTTVAHVAQFAMVGYVLWYPYAAMRRYYHQGRLLTTSKYFSIAFAYFVSLLLTLLGTAVITALNE